MEFAKNGDIEEKCVSDAAKAMLEGKRIWDQIVKTAKINSKEAKELNCSMIPSLLLVKVNKLITNTRIMDVEELKLHPFVFIKVRFEECLHS